MFTYYLKDVVLSFAIGVVVAAMATPVSIMLAHKLGILDIPKDDRRMHKKPIPRFGGFGIFCGVMAAMVIPASMNTSIRIALIGGVLVFVLGVADDIANLKPIVKFVGQWAIATLMYVLGIRIKFLSTFLAEITTGQGALLVVGEIVAYIITVLWIVGITNSVNLMDGLDGLAAGSTAIMALSIAYVAYIHGSMIGMMPVCIALVAVAGGCIGFLPYNFSPAKTFMGDGGALFLGYMIAIMSVISPLKKATLVGIIIPVMALAVPLFDTGFAMIRRLARRESIMKADRGHLHHHLMAAGFGQRRSVLIIYGIVGIMGMSAVLVSRELYKDAIVLALIAALYLTIIIVPKTPKKTFRGILNAGAISDSADGNADKSKFEDGKNKHAEFEQQKLVEQSYDGQNNKRPYRRP